MTFKEVVEQLHQEGKTEEEAMNIMITKVQAAGAEWTPPKMELFYKAWSHLEGSSKPKTTSIPPADIDETDEPVIPAPVASKKVKKEFPIKSLKKEKVEPVAAPIVKKKVFPIEKLKKKITPTPIANVGEKPTPLKTANPEIQSGNLGSFNTLLIFNLAAISWLNGKNLSSIRDLLSSSKSTLDSFIKKINMKSSNYNAIYKLMLDAKKYSDKHASEVVGLGKDLAEIFSVFESREYHFSADRLKLLKDLFTYFKSNKRSANQFKNVVNRARVLNIPALNKLFAGDVAARLPKVSPEELGKTYARWLDLNKKLGGNQYQVIPVPVVPPKKYDKKGKIIPHVKPEKTLMQVEYGELSKTLRDYYKDMIRYIVLTDGEKLPNSGHTTMDVEDVKVELATLGMKWNNIPVNFVGRINTEAQLCTSQGWKITHPMGGVVRMDKKTYDPTTGFGGYCVGVKPVGVTHDGKLVPSKGTQRCFSEKHTQTGGYRDNKKIGAVDNFLEHETTYRNKWFQVIKAGVKKPADASPLFIKAVVIESMYQVAPRPGSDEKGGTNTHFTEETKGFTYLQKENVSIDANKVTFDFYDKNGRQLLYLHKAGRPEPDPQDPTEAAILYNAVKYFYDKAPTDKTFIWVGPDNKNIKYGELTKYLRSIVPEPFGLHKFRHVKATKIAMSILGSCPYKVGKTNSAELSDFYMKAMGEVGAKLGHRSVDVVSPKQAIVSYVSKTVSRGFFERYDVKELPNIAKDIKEGDSEESSSKEYNIIVGKNKKRG